MCNPAEHSHAEGTRLASTEHANTVLLIGTKAELLR